MEFETVIGLEVHVELKTESKIFLPARKFRRRTEYKYDPLLTLVIPEYLPVLNKEAVEFGNESVPWL